MTLFEQNMDVQPGLPLQTKNSYKRIPDEAVPDDIDLTFLTPDYFYSSEGSPAFLGRGMEMKYTIDMTIINAIPLPGTHDVLLVRITIDFDKDYRVVNIVLQTRQRLDGPKMPIYLNSRDYNIILPQWMIYSAKHSIQAMVRRVKAKRDAE